MFFGRFTFWLILQMHWWVFHQCCICVFHVRPRNTGMNDRAEHKPKPHKMCIIYRYVRWQQCSSLRGFFFGFRFSVQQPLTTPKFGMHATRCIRRVTAPKWRSRRTHYIEYKNWISVWGGGPGWTTLNHTSHHPHSLILFHRVCVCGYYVTHARC